MGAIGLATGLACALLGVPAPLLLGLVAALTEAIPLVGPLLGAIPAVLLAATVSPELAVIVAGVYLVLQVIEGNVLVPIVMRNTIGISPFLVILSLLVGGTVGGFAGALLAVPVAATFELIVEGLQARERPVAQDPTVGEPDGPVVAEPTARRGRSRRHNERSVGPDGAVGALGTLRPRRRRASWRRRPDPRRSVPRGCTCSPPWR
jgi:hypothetical protein